MSERVEEYATGLATIASAEGQLDRVADEIFQLGRAIESNDELRATLVDQGVPASRRIGVLEDLMSTGSLPLTLELVSMLVGAGRGGHIAGIGEALVRQAADWTLAVWRRSGKDPRLLGSQIGHRRPCSLRRERSEGHSLPVFLPLGPGHSGGSRCNLCSFSGPRWCS